MALATGGTEVRRLFPPDPAHMCNLVVKLRVPTVYPPLDPIVLETEVILEEQCYHF